MAVHEIVEDDAAPRQGQSRRGIRRQLRRHATVVLGAAVLSLIVLLTLIGPWLVVHDPLTIDPLNRMAAPSAQHILGTDAFGRDLFSRTIHGGRISLTVGLVVGVAASVIGLGLGLISGYSRIADAILMRVMDGLMSIPTILLAIALMAVTRASVYTVIFAITIVELPRVVRLVRSVVLTIREQAFIEAATISGTRFLKVLIRHILPNTVAPMTVQATYICAAAILIEIPSVLSRGRYAA